MTSSPPELYLIGFTGAAGAGKDTAGTVLAMHGYRTLAFADALRVDVSQAWLIDMSTLTRPETKEHPISSLAIGRCIYEPFLQWARAQGLDLRVPRSPRWIMQRWGTEFRRARHPDYWVERVRQRIARLHEQGIRHIAITDVRFPNEAELVRLLGGYVVRIVRPELPQMSEDTSTHASEHHPELRADLQLINRGGLAHLHEDVLSVARQLYGPEGVPSPTVVTPGGATA